MSSENSAESDALHARVHRFIESSMRGYPLESFDALALDLARFQATSVPAVRRLFEARSVNLDGAQGAAEIPALPCDVFRLTRVAAHEAALDVRVFRTSGTSQGSTARGEHPMRTMATYELAALAWGHRMLWPDRAKMRSIVLAAPPEEVSDSSLGFMMALFADALGGPASFHLRGGALSAESVAVACANARAAGEPTIVLGASFAYVHLFEGGAGLDFRLPPHSRVMQTGGFKGRSREVEPNELRAQICDVFGIHEAYVVGEYGMTELSSQAYEATLASALDGRPQVILPGESVAKHGEFIAPPWMRVSAVDPVSLSPVDSGDVGIARIVDLANVDSAVVIQTADRVRVSGDGRRIELLGRAPGATPRGCSIAIDEILSAERG